MEQKSIGNVIPLLPTLPNVKKFPNENGEIKSIYTNESYIDIEYLK